MGVDIAEHPTYFYEDWALPVLRLTKEYGFPWIVWMLSDGLFISDGSN